jgi:indoleamine 2,3-dioxygenase
MEILAPVRGFLPAEDPATSFDPGSELSMLDALGRDLPSLLMDRSFRAYARGLQIPRLAAAVQSQAQLRLYYVRLGFLASAYVNQVGEGTEKLLPSNIAVPLCDVAARLSRPPILSYDGYALFNWRRFDPDGTVALGNIDTFQNFVHMYDEHWFILVHVNIEAIAARTLRAVGDVTAALSAGDESAANAGIAEMGASIRDQVAVLRRIPEKMDPSLYYKTFRPYIRFFEDVVYEGVDQVPVNQRGETGAQSSILPAMVAFLKIPHKPSALTNHLADMRRFMPVEHRELLATIESLPDIRGRVDKTLYNEVLEALAAFREVHLGFARDYIDRWVEDPRGTGGTPFMKWLGQLIDETRAHKIP